MKKVDGAFPCGESRAAIEAKTAAADCASTVRGARVLDADVQASAFRTEHPSRPHHDEPAEQDGDEAAEDDKLGKAGQEGFHAADSSGGKSASENGTPCVSETDRTLRYSRIGK